MAATRKAKITFISAGAGSGKTHRLTEILQQELTQRGVRPSGVIATTFTKKAAAELRERVRSHLLSQGDFVRAHAMGQARIGTVNGVCGALIERFAFEAGMATNQQVLDEAPAEALLEKAIDSALSGPAMGAFLNVVRRLGLGDAWKDALKDLVDLVRSNDIPVERLAVFATDNAQDLLGHFPGPTKQNLTALLRDAIEIALPQIESVAQSKGRKNTNEYLSFLKEFARALERESATWGDWVKLSKQMPEVALKPVAEPIAELAARAPEHAGLHEDIRRYLAQIFDLCAQALGLYARNKRELGLLDFADQESILLTLLDHPTVAQVLSDELDLLLVDEFQDTSPIQLALFLHLSRFAKAVYWVGDVKQAIYGFRGSDTALMQAIIKALPGMGGVQEVLPDSWRSRPELVQVVNAVFIPAFANSLPPAQVKLEPVRKDKLPGAPVANWILSGKNVGQEASALGEGIRKLVESGYQVIDKGAAASRNVRYGDIAVLARMHEGVMRIAGALSAQGIPCATAQPGLLATPEATLALACLRRLSDPSDTIATAEILALADCADPQEWVSDRLRYLNAGGDPDGWLEIGQADFAAHPLVARLGTLRKTLPVLAPREALETVMVDCDIAAKVVRWSPDAERARVRLANIDALLDLATRYEDLCRSGQHAASVSGLILWLGEIAEAKEDMLADPGIDAVKVLTHHGSKGLEWPVVILMDLAADIKDRLWSISAQSAGALDTQSPLAGRFARYWPWPFGPQKTVAVADQIALTPLAQTFRESATEEAKRLLYVSTTRARDLLVLARSSRKASGTWLECLGAPWLLPADGTQDIALPDGKVIAGMRWELLPEGEGEPVEVQEGGPLRWFPSDAPRMERLPLNFSPSGADGQPGIVIETAAVGARIPVASGVDMAQLGNAMHACIAASFSDPKSPLDFAGVVRILRGFGVEKVVDAGDVAAQIEALRRWIDTRWPGARCQPEWPVERRMVNGQHLRGWVDLLIQAPEGWIIIDHKSSPLAESAWETFASQHAAQFDAYANAVEAASGSPVVERWIFLPVAGGAVRLGKE